MRARKWTVGILSEFDPPPTSKVYGLNGGGGQVRAGAASFFGVCVRSLSTPLPTGPFLLLCTRAYVMTVSFLLLCTRAYVMNAPFRFLCARAYVMNVSFLLLCARAYAALSPSRLSMTLSRTCVHVLTLLPAIFLPCVHVLALHYVMRSSSKCG